MRKSQIQEEEIKMFLLENLSNIETKLGNDYEELKRVKWTFKHLNQWGEQEKSNVKLETFDPIKDTQKIFSSILGRYETLSHNFNQLQTQLNKYKDFNVFQDKQIKNLKQEQAGNVNTLKLYLTWIDNLREIVNRKNKEAEHLKRTNLNLKKHIQVSHKNVNQRGPKQENFLNEGNLKSLHLLNDYIRSIFSNLNKMLTSNCSLIEISANKVRDYYKKINTTIQEVEAIKRDLENIQENERSVGMWNIWRNNEHDELIEKVDSIAQQVNGIESELNNYQSLIKEYNEALNKYEENYNSLKAALENIEVYMNETQAEESSYVEDLEKELQFLKESEQSYKEQINTLNKKLEKQKEKEQKYQKRLKEINHMGQQVNPSSSNGPTRSNESKFNLETRRENQYQEFPMTNTSKSTEFDPNKYNKNFKKRSK